MNSLSVRNRPLFAGISCVLLFLSGCGDFFVAADAPVSISISPSNPSVRPGSTQQLSALETLGDGTTRDVTSKATWTSATPAIATINSSGLATAVALGSTTITVVADGMTGTTTLTVTNQIIQSIAITPTNPTVTVGQTQQFTATATFPDNTTADVTSSVVWTTSNPGVATISNTGLATALTPGTTTITATRGAVTASTSLTVQ